MRDNSNDPSPWAVICFESGVDGAAPCGLQFLPELGPQGYYRQIEKADREWVCPTCGGRAVWDDECQETNPLAEKTDDSIEKGRPYHIRYIVERGKFTTHDNDFIENKHGLTDSLVMISIVKKIGSSSFLVMGVDGEKGVAIDGVGLLLSWLAIAERLKSSTDIVPELRQIVEDALKKAEQYHKGASNGPPLQN